MVNLYNSAIFYSKNNFNLADTLKRELRDNNIELVYISEAHKLLESIIENQTSMIFFDESIRNNLDIVSNIALKSCYLKRTVVTFIDNDENLYKPIVDNVKTYWLSDKLEKHEIDKIVRKRNLSFEDKLNINYNKLSRDLTEYLINLGFSQKYIGFNYIKETIIKLLKMGGTFRSLQTEIYPLIALKYNCGIVNIERNIRSVIGDAKKTENFKKVSLSPDKVTNRLFLTYLLDKTLNSIVEQTEI